MGIKNLNTIIENHTKNGKVKRHLSYFANKTFAIDTNVYLYKYLYGGLAIITLIFAEILVRYSGSSYQYSLIYYLFPIIFIPILYLEILRKFAFENLRK